MLKWFLKKIARNPGIALGLVLALAGAARAAGAGDYEQPAQIRAAVEAALAPRLAAIANASPMIEVGEIDPRLHLPPCPALNIGLPPGTAAAMTAKVSCPAPAWTLYVPLRVHAFVEAVVAAGNLAANTTLGAADLTLGRVDVLAGSGALVTDPAQAEGKILRASLPAGAPIITPLLALPITVHRGDTVVLTLEDRSMTIKAPAVALEDGRIGQSILVQNPESRKSLHATVAADGSVEMKF